MATTAKEDGKPELPPDLYVKWISPKNAEKLGLKTGENIKDLVEYKMFSLKFMKDDAQTFGNFSEFVDVLPHFVDYPPDEEVMLEIDLNKRYGETYVFHKTVESKRKYFSKAEDAKKAVIEAEKKRIAALEAKKKKEEAERNAVWEEKTFYPRKIVSATAAETDEEMALLQLQPSRPLFRLTVSRQRSKFCQPCTFADYDPDGTVREFRSKRDPNFDLKRREIDIGLQAGPSAFTNKADVATQTVKFRKANKAVLCTSQTKTEDEIETMMDTVEFVQFMDDSCFDVEQALQQNETTDMFMNDLEAIHAGDELATGKSNETDIKPLGSPLFSMMYSKGRSLSDIQWHPMKKGVILVACTSNLTFDQRCDIAGQARYSHNLIWNFRDLLHPEKVLRTPHETFVCSFNPTQPDVIAGGLISGQVIVWDMKDKDAAPADGAAADGDGTAATGAAAGGRSASGHNAATAGKEAMGGGSANGELVEHTQLSSIDHSHRGPVTDLHWLPDCREVDAKGNVSINPDGETHQFATVSGDGQVLFWDLRHKKKRARQAMQRRRKRPEEILWIPIYAINLNGSTPATTTGNSKGITRVLLGPGSIDSGKGSPSEFVATTEEGELLFGDWNAAEKNAGLGDSTGPSAAASAALGDNKKGGSSSGPSDGADDPMQYIRSSHFDHFRPAVSLQRSPFFEGVLLSVSVYAFNLWREGVKEPIFKSPMASSPILCGTWSCTRPGVLFIGKAEGQIDVWDLTDMSHKPHLNIHVGSSAVTSIQFWKHTKQSKQALLAVGDSSGSLHIFDMPAHLRQPITNEEAIMGAYLAREAQQSKYNAKMRTKASQEGVVSKPTQDDASKRSKPTSIEQDPKTLQEREKEYRKIESHFRELFKDAVGTKTQKDSK